MSKLRYDSRCIVCKKEFIAKKKGTQFCSNICRAQYSRDNKLKLIKDQGEIIETQKRVLKSNARITAAVMPDPVKVAKVSCEVGKDLTECKRPDGSHLYSDQDLWILIARINQLVFNENSGTLLGQMDTNMKAEALIRDFEKRFDCRFDDVKRANPKVRPGSTDAENESLIIKYAELHYSR